jgi:hypothetical protein
LIRLHRPGQWFFLSSEKLYFSGCDGVLLEVRYVPFHSATAPSGPGPPHRAFTISLSPLSLSHAHTHTHSHGNTPLDEYSARRRHFYLTTHNTLKRQQSMPLAEFEPAVPARERSQTRALDRAATGIRPLKQLPFVSYRMLFHIYTPSMETKLI